MHGLLVAAVEPIDFGAPTPSLAASVREMLHARRRGFRRISVSSDTTSVYLHGCVCSFHLRQLAFAFATQMSGAFLVVDELVVDFPATSA